MSDLESELQAAGISAIRFLEAVVTTDVQPSGVTRLRNDEILVPLATNIPYRVELARYLVDMAMHYDRRRQAE